MFKFITKNKKVMDKMFVERVMLAVTEVNGCKMCYQGHAKMALESGLTETEINELVNNNQDNVPQHQQVALLYATHYADVSGRPDKEATKKLFDTYKRGIAKSIISAIRMIMLGNTLGIVASTVELKKSEKREAGSSLSRELIIFLGSLVLLPIFILVFVIGMIVNY
ncbi:MAG: carboxymuconolactone decarboxylase family protein [Bacilli bacterium]